ncbi:hypothetical protein GCM10009850_082370 [Nonomuraea monospora]|uniref:Uncharacterized protein n=1 Tax=Nonomuraea monospora TaxID=568818 RepID=A0ABP5PM32_9ACTN
MASPVGLTGFGSLPGVLVTGAETTGFAAGGFCGTEVEARSAGGAFVPQPVASTRHPARRVAVIVRIPIRRITAPGGSGD